MRDTIIIGLKVVIVSWVLVAQFQDEFVQQPAENIQDTACCGMRSLRNLFRHHAAPSQDLQVQTACEMCLSCD